MTGGLDIRCQGGILAQWLWQKVPDRETGDEFTLTSETIQNLDKVHEMMISKTLNTRP